MKQPGFTMMEIVISTAIGAVLIVGVMGSLKTCTSSRDKLFSRGDAETEVSQLSETLLQVGRIAQDCKLTDGALDCSIDYNVPPTGQLTRVAFSYKKNTGGGQGNLTVPRQNVEYAAGALINPSVLLNLSNSRAQAAPSPLIMQEYINNQWVSKRTFENIEAVEFCDDLMMKNGSCTLEPKAISDRHKDNLSAAKGPTPANRFFRFKITGISAKEDVGKKIQIQTSFYRRNPTSVPNLLYQWGMQE